MRMQFAALERQQLEEMRTWFQPSIARTSIEGVKVVVVTPPSAAARTDHALLYIHGGGYVMGSATDRTGMLMAHELGLKMYSVDYQVAPEAKFPVALEECLKVYRHLVKTYAPSKVAVVSTSAGSGHALGMLLKAQEEGLPMIGASALLSPSVDLTQAGDSMTSNAGRDLMTYENHADKLYIAPFVGSARLDDPLVSPVYGTYREGFPATVIVTGTRDVFLSGSTRLYWKLRRATVPAELLVAEGMWHAFTSYPDLPEAVESRQAVRSFVEAHLGARAEGGAPGARPRMQPEIEAPERTTP
ncbi:alpha/beta hydrolase [Chondromyces apiculatus]|nr:alpha/beta hydrolase [Chondromyces apiculatus]